MPDPLTDALLKTIDEHLSRLPLRLRFLTLAMLKQEIEARLHQVVAEWEGKKLMEEKQ